MRVSREIEDLLRELAPQVLGLLVRRYREFDACEDAVQEALIPADELLSSGPDDDRATHHDDTLTLLVLCCHPALPPASQMALTLRAVGGLTTSQVARAFLVPDVTMGQRRYLESMAARLT